MWKIRLSAILILILGCFAGYFVYESQPQETLHESENQALVDEQPFSLGLDLAGGSQLIYRADVSHLPDDQVEDSMASLRDVIERRVNLFGVSEPTVQVEQGSFVNQGEERLLVELPGVTDIDEAVEMIGKTPLLEFKVENPEFNTEETQAMLEQEATINEDGTVEINADSLPEQFVATELTGRYLKRANLEFVGGAQGMQGGAFTEPAVILQFTQEGSDLFEEITTEHTGEVVAIFLDGAPISTPVVQEPITGGEAVISGDFTADEAKQLVGRLNSGALPVPIELISTQTVGPSLGQSAIEDGMKAGLIGFLVVAIFLVLWYRLPGVVAVVSLSIYVAIMLALFKLIPVTLTAAGIAGFIISLGIAVDANILIFERVREELADGQTLREAIVVGFNRAWTSIRDANISSILSAAILFWFGTSLIQGFALTFGIGVIVSMISAITISRILLLALSVESGRSFIRLLFQSGLEK